MYGTPTAKAPFQKTGKKAIACFRWELVSCGLCRQPNPRHLLGARVTAPQLNFDSISSQQLLKLQGGLVTCKVGLPLG